MSRDDDPDAPLTPAEEARAAGFAHLVDGLLAGEVSPPAMDADDRALLEAATVVLASSRAIELDPADTRRLVGRAFESAITSRHGRTSGSRTAADPSAASASLLSRGPLHRGERLARILPWAVATIATAAAVILFVTRPADLTGELPASPAAQARLQPNQISRPSDELIGRIPHPEVDQASRRLDAIYGDRMAGYRDLVLGGGAP